MDTRAKRSSAISLAPWVPVLPPSDGSIDRPDRKQLAFTYRGEAEATGTHAHGTLEWHLTHSATLEQV